jgi:hypothetical protein
MIGPKKQALLDARPSPIAQEGACADQKHHQNGNFWMLGLVEQLAPNGRS